MHETTQPFAIRPLVTEQDLEACLALQRATWGEDFRELVPAAMLQITQKVGGVAAGAFDDTDSLVGFVYGITGVRDGVLSHWSHMLAVHERWRGQGIGRALKHYQRERVRANGVQQMLWTFDPLVARNAHLNLNRLGAFITEYVRNMYGETSMSKTDSVIGTDRFIVCWDLSEPVSVPPPTVPHAWTEAPIVTLGSVEEMEATRSSLPTASVVRIAIPGDVQSLKRQDPDTAASWREITRCAFEHYLAHGYTVRRFVHDPHEGRDFYVVEQE